MAFRVSTTKRTLQALNHSTVVVQFEIIFKKKRKFPSYQLTSYLLSAVTPVSILSFFVYR